MIHFLPNAAVEPAPGPYAEAVARLAGIRHALKLVDPDAAEPEPAWDLAPAPGAATRCFEAKSEQTIAAAAAGIETVLALRAAGHEPNRAAMCRIADEIRGGLADLEHLLKR
ncbi:MAG: hypothetical protein ABIP91_05995 [Sphingomicrobium sp.]